MNQPALIRIGIVADDLTSATDGAAPFLPKGYVPLISQSDAEPWQSELVAVDTNSRALTEQKAAQAVASAISTMRDRSILLKTIDSTLQSRPLGPKALTPPAHGQATLSSCRRARVASISWSHSITIRG